MTFSRSNGTGAAAHPALVAVQQARQTLAAERERDWLRRQSHPAPRWPSASLALAEEALRLKRLEAAEEQGRALGLLIGAEAPLVLSTGQPAWCDRVRNWSNWDRLLDHCLVYRLAGSRGQPSLKNSVVVTEPYFGDIQVRDSLKVWSEALEPHGLVMRQLPKAWLLHAPDDETSQRFMVASPSLIG